MVVIIHNTPDAAAASALCPESNAEVLEQVHAVATALKKSGIAFTTVGIRTLQELPALLMASPADIVVNLVESLQGWPDTAAYVPAVCRACDKACTGGDTAALLLTADKWRTKAVLRAAGVPVPDGVRVAVDDTSPAYHVPTGRLIVKPLGTDGSEGIDARSSIFDGACSALVERVHMLQTQFRQPVLIEQFWGTREFQAALLEQDGDVRVLAIAEIDFSTLDPAFNPVVDYAAKWHSDSHEYIHTPRILPARIAPAFARELSRLAVRAWQATGCNDYARVDFRANDTSAPVVLEVNVNPDIAPESGYAAALAHAGIDYDTFITTIIRNASQRSS